MLGMIDMMATLTALVLAVAIAAVSLTITRASIFKPFRLWVEEHSTFFGELVSCPYCMSHWVALVVVSIFKTRVVVSSVPPADYLLTIFFLVSVSCLVAAPVFLAVATIHPRDEE